MSKEQENKAIVGRWFKESWGNPWNPKIVDQLGTWSRSPTWSEDRWIRVFRSSHRLGLALAFTCLATVLAIAQGAPQPAPEMSQLKFFLGTFKCKGDALPSPVDPSGRRPIERTITSKMDLDDFFLFMRMDDTKTKENPRPIRGNWQLIYDGKEKNFVAIWTDNLGRWFPQTSVGWQKDVITFTGEFTMNDKKGVVRDVLTKKSEQEMVMTVDLQSGSSWVPFLELTCRK
jgi:hypothetical protein